MDRDQFDTLARLVWRRPSRRSALGALIGAALLGLPLPTVAAKPKRKRTRTDRDRRRDDRTRARKRKQPGKKQAPATDNPAPAGDAVAAAEAADCLNPGPSSNLNGCTFNNRDLTGVDLSSSSMRGTRFRGADLCGADLSSSQLKNADFRGANLTRADLHSSGCVGIQTNAGTTFCQTTMCNGSVRNDDCPPGVDPEAICCTDADCGGDEFCCQGRCVTGACCVNSDCGPNQLCQGNLCCETDLAAAVAAANPGDIIPLCAGRFRTVDVRIQKNLTIVGAGAGEDPDTATILDAEGDGRILRTEADIEIRDLRITGGEAPTVGAIFNPGILRLIGVSVVGNTVTTRITFTAGAILNQGTLTLGANTRVVENTGIEGGAITNAGTLTLQHGSVVAGNTVDNIGGGILNLGAMTLENGSRVEDNEARLGGGIFNGGGATATLKAGSRVTGNTAREAGGGVRVVSGTVTVEAADIVTGNTSTQCDPALPNCPLN